MAENILGKLSGGPLDGQFVPREVESITEIEDKLVLPWDQGQLVYLRFGEATQTGPHDGPTTVSYRYDPESSSNPVPEA